MRFREIHQLRQFFFSMTLVDAHVESSARRSQYLYPTENVDDEMTHKKKRQKERVIANVKKDALHWRSSNEKNLGAKKGKSRDFRGGYLCLVVRCLVLVVCVPDA